MNVDVFRSGSFRPRAHSVLKKARYGDAQSPIYGTGLAQKVSCHHGSELAGEKRCWQDSPMKHEKKRRQKHDRNHGTRKEDRKVCSMHYVFTGPRVNGEGLGFLRVRVGVLLFPCVWLVHMSPAFPISVARTSGSAFISAEAWCSAVQVCLIAAMTTPRSPLNSSDA